MAAKPYKAKTQKAAETRVRLLLREREHLMQFSTNLIKERRLLAQLAATGPAFYNPLLAWEAQIIRDRILAEECRLNPDGSPLNG